jgi:hypothetical protein
MKTVAASSSLFFYLLLSISLAGCTAVGTLNPDASPPTPALFPGDSTSAAACPVTEPVWAKPPEDPAVDGAPAFGYYFLNQDRSMWASAWWMEAEDYQLSAGEEGIKVGWFRPEGIPLEISGQRLDGEAPPLDAHVPCCYPTRFQSSGLIFPTQGCWQVAAKAGESELSFVIWVAP